MSKEECIEGTAWLQASEIVAFMPEDKSYVEFYDGINKSIKVDIELMKTIFRKILMGDS